MIARELRRPRVVVPEDRGRDLAVVALLTAAVCIPVWPGIYTIDSQAILAATRRDEISDWYAPLLGWAWGRLDDIGVPPGLVFAASVATFVVTVRLLVGSFLEARAARVVTAIVVLFPPVYGLLGWFGRDVWFATAALGITAVALRIHRSAVASTSSIVVLVTFSVIAMDSRQNGLPFAVLGFGVAGSAIISRIRQRPSTAELVGVTVGAAVLGVLVVNGLQAAAVQVDHHPGQILLARDLTAVSLALDEPMMDAELFPSQDVDRLRTVLDGRDPDAVVGLDPPALRYTPFEDQSDSDAVNEAFTEQWRAMVREHPLAYLDSRLDLHLLQLGVSRDVRSPYFGQSDALTGSTSASGVENSFPALLDTRRAYLSWTDGPDSTGSVLHAPILYLVAAVLSIWTLGRRTGERGPARVLIAVLLAMQSLLFFTAPTSEYRFQFFQVVFGTVFLAILVVIEVWPEHARTPPTSPERLGRLARS